MILTIKLLLRMKKNIFTISGLSVVFVVAIFAVSTLTEKGTTKAYAYASSSPGGKTNSPGDVNNCTQCHSGTLNSGNGTATITSPALASGYVPGQTYTIGAALSPGMSSKIGFEVTAERDADNSKTGTIIITDAARTKTVSAGNAITHNAAAGTAATGGSNVWSFDWVAPATGTGAVTFYGAFNAANGNSSSSGDQVYTATFNVIENIGVGVDEINLTSTIQLYPNPATTYFQISSDENIIGVEIFNLNGKKIVEENSYQDKINIEELSSGVYFVSIKTDQGATVEKLIIQ